MSFLTLRLAVVSSLVVAHAVGLRAQCPDGTPPPCSGVAPGRAIAKVAVSVPSASDRARHFLILPFRNVTRQPEQDWLVEGSTTMLSDALGRWQGVTVVSDERLYPALKRVGAVPGTVIDAPRVRRLAEETGGWTAVTGEVLSTGGHTRITARAVDVATNRELVRAASDVASGGDVRVAYDSVGLRLLRSAGLDSVASDLAGATTHNLDAYRAYLRGLARMRRSEIKTATTDFQEAVRLDSTFALAWVRLAEVTVSSEPGSLMNPGSKAAQYSARAVSLSAKLPPRQRQLVLANDALFRAQFAEARGILEALVAADSNDVEALAALTGIEMSDPVLVKVPGGQRPRGSVNRAARLAKRVAELDPSRHAMYSVLASIYANAGVPGVTPVFAVDRAPTSFSDFVQLVQQREHRRLYYPVFRDSIALVPVESLAFIPKDSLKAMRQRARAYGISWAQRWMSVASDEAAPFQLISELHALDGDYPAALRELAKAESLGVQTPAWSAPAKRLTYLGKSGDLAAATRLADSLTDAGFFAKPVNVNSLGDAGAWAFALHLLAPRAARARALLDQATSMRRALSSAGPPPEYIAYEILMGNTDPEEEPGISRAFRARQLDSLLKHVVEFGAADALGGFVPSMLPTVAEGVDPKRPRVAGLLKAADALAAAGRPVLAFQLASNAVVSDSTLEVEAATFPWYKAGATALNAVRVATNARFHPASASIGADQAVFEWKVDDSAPFVRNRAETPPDRGEYRWEVTLATDARYYRLRISEQGKIANSAPVSGTLADLLAPAARVVIAGAVGPNGVEKDTTALGGVGFRTEAAPGALRMIVTDRAVLDVLRRGRPAQARFQFYPCVQPLGTTGKLDCVNQVVPVTYP